MGSLVWIINILIVTMGVASSNTMSLEAWVKTANELLQRHNAMGALPPNMTPGLMQNRTRAYILHDLTSHFRAHVYWRVLSELNSYVIIEEPLELRSTGVVNRVMSEWEERGFQVMHLTHESKYILQLR